MVFTHTVSELRRRKIAYYSLILGILFGYLIWSILLYNEITPVIPIITTLIFGVLGIISFKSINSLTKEKVVITDSTIERSNQDKSEVYSLNNISLLRIKRRRNGVTREIEIHFQEGISIYLNAFENDFIKIEEELRSRLKGRVDIREFREIINLDSAFFYPSLGLLMSLLFVGGINYGVRIDITKIRYIFFLFTVSEVSLGMYFILARPISRRMGKKNIRFDYLLGLVFVLAGIVLPMSILNLTI